MKSNELFISDNLPSKLGTSEVKNYFEKIKNGDAETRKSFIIHNIRLVINNVRKFNNQNYDERDLVCVGIIGLIKSVDSFDINKKIQFSTYAGKCINNEIIQFLKKDRKHLDYMSLDSTVRLDNDGEKLKLEDILSDENVDLVGSYELKEEKNIIREILSTLEKEEQEIIILFFGFFGREQHSQTELAEILGISQSYISKKLKRILLKFRYLLSLKGINSIEEAASLSK